MSQRAGRRGPSLSLPGHGGAADDAGGAVSRIYSSITESVAFNKTRRAAGDTVTVCKKIMRSTGKAAWIAGTTFLVLVVPLIIEMDREQQLSDLESQQASLLGSPSTPPNV